MAANSRRTGAGYSGTPLPKKLGFRQGQKVMFVALPGTLSELASCAEFASVAEAADWREVKVQGGGFDAIHAFTSSREELAKGLPGLEAAIVPDGMIWISWPKRAARVATDVTEDVVRAEALRGDLVDVKVAAVDDRWSGLKLVIRKEARPRHGGKAR
ncbi:MAG: DUF3052 domain-containing protein [Cucumibacter sp.]